jgi:hypothetical protein
VNRCVGAAGLLTLAFTVGLAAAPTAWAVDPVPGLIHDAVAGQPCSNTKVFIFGEEARGGFLACASTMHGGVWRPSAPLVGVRQIGSTCAEPVVMQNVAAQSPDGQPLVCDGARAVWIVNN